MSFSSDVKNEIIQKEYTREHAAISELAAMICFGGKLRKIEGKYIFSIVSENPKISRRAYSLMKGALAVSSRIKIKKISDKITNYEVVVENKEDIEKLFKATYLIDENNSINSFVSFHIDPKLVVTRERKAAFARGSFLTCGSVMNPQKNYHLEFATSHYSLSNEFSVLLEELGIPAKTVIRKSKYVLYYKSSDIITDVLTVLGAVNSLMEYHNAKIVKEMRNKINRTINCETANLNKTVDASFEQAACIQKLMDKGVFETLPDSLQDIGRLRLEYREHSLKELGEMLNPPIGKSGVNHRLRKLMDIANNI
ncbi:MAG: DNA-binding protein WhiA [Clostridia bacterium]|nr:DNA-binding protein WhiA [Clostridia bacterium]